MDYRGFTLSANISIMFTELDYLDRIPAARKAGFDSVESWWPFASATPEQTEIETLLTALAEAEVALAGLNFFAGDMPAGQRGITCDPARESELAANIEVVAEIARRTGCQRFNLLYGQPTDAVDADAQRASAVRGYQRAAQAVADTGGVVLIEPLAKGLNGNYPLLTDTDVIELLDSSLADTTGVGFLFDTFHLASNGVDVIASAARYADRIGHVQLADAPGRGEPGSGSLDFAAIMDTLSGAGYRGTVAAEYKPTKDTAETLGWLTAN